MAPATHISPKGEAFQRAFQALSTLARAKRLANFQRAKRFNPSRLFPDLELIQNIHAQVFILLMLVPFPGFG